MSDVRIQPKVEHPKCPYCHEAVRASDDKAPCLACMAWHHRACRAEHGRCAACGAEGDGGDRAPGSTEAQRSSEAALGPRAGGAAARSPDAGAFRPWWRAEPSSTPTRPAPEARPAPRPVDDATEQFGEGPALPPPDQRHRPLGAGALLVYLALLTALALIVLAAG